MFTSNDSTERGLCAHKQFEVNRNMYIFCTQFTSGYWNLGKTATVKTRYIKSVLIQIVPYSRAIFYHAMWNARVEMCGSVVETWNHFLLHAFTYQHCGKRPLRSVLYELRTLFRCCKFAANLTDGSRVLRFSGLLRSE